MYTVYAFAMRIRQSDVQIVDMLMINLPCGTEIFVRTAAQKWRKKMFEAFAAGVRSGIFLLGVGVGLLGGLTAALVLGRAIIEACKALTHKL